MKEKKKGWKKTKTYLSQVDEGEQQSVPLEARHRAGPGKPCGKERRIKRAGNSPWSGRLADRWQPGQGEDRGRFSGGRGGGLEGGFGGSAGVDGGWVLGGSRQPLPQSHVCGSATGFVLSIKKKKKPHQTLINSSPVLTWQVREWSEVWVTRVLPLPSQPETHEAALQNMWRSTGQRWGQNFVKRQGGLSKGFRGLDVRPPERSLALAGNP